MLVSTCISSGKRLPLLEYFQRKTTRKLNPHYLTTLYCSSSVSCNMNWNPDVLKIFQDAVAAVKPEQIIKHNVSMIDGKNVKICDKVYPINNNVFVVGFGKAVYRMGVALSDILDKHIVKGILSVPVGSKIAGQSSQLKSGTALMVCEGAKNNLPDMAAENTALDIYKLLVNLNEKQVLIVLISGGGSALLPLPMDGISLQDKLSVVQLLSKAGASILELNTVRSLISKLKANKLAYLAYPAKIVTLILSDVVGDDLRYVASGTTFPSQFTAAEGILILQKYNVWNKIPDSVVESLGKLCTQSPQLDTLCADNNIVGNNKMALEAAVNSATTLGYKAVIVTDKFTGEAKLIASKVAQICNYIYSNPSRHELTNLFQQLSPETVNSDDVDMVLQYCQLKESFCLVMGGESTVTVTGTGLGGRNQEMAVAISLILNSDGCPDGVTVLCAGTDGQDGPTDAAGAIANSSMARKAADQGMELSEYLSNNDTYTALSLLCSGNFLIKSGLTGTNVMDIILIVFKWI